MTLWQKLVSFGFRLLYNELAWTYDLVSWLVSLGRWREWQTAALGFVTGRDVLEIAHGPGHILLKLHQRGFRVTGCDLSPAMSRIAANRLHKANLAQQIPLFRCAIPDIPIKATSFDTVLSQFPTSFIFEPATLSTIFKILRPHGRLVILPEAQLTGQGPIYRLITWLFIITGQREKESSTNHTNLDPGIWHPLTNRLHQAGFTNISVETITLPTSQATLIIAQKP